MNILITSVLIWCFMGTLFIIYNYITNMPLGKDIKSNIMILIFWPIPLCAYIVGYVIGIIKGLK